MAPRLQRAILLKELEKGRSMPDRLAGWRVRGRSAAFVAGCVMLAIFAQSTSSAAPDGRILSDSSQTGVLTKKPTPLQRIAGSLVAAGAPGAIVYVRTPNGARYATAGLAQIEPRVLMNLVDHYRIGSVTKTFVATAVLQLVAQGKLRLDDSVDRWLPGVVPSGAAITLRMLLNHTSGLYNLADDPELLAQVTANLGREWAPEELLPFALSHPPLFAPGSASAYSNTGYVLLGLVVEKVTSKPLPQVLREQLFEPLHLQGTSFPSVIAMPSPAAHGYWAPSGKLVDLTPIFNPSAAYAAGQMVSTVSDLSRFFGALLGGRVLPASLLRQMKPAAVVPKSGWVAGLGLLATRTPCGTAFGHGGDILGWHNEALATANGRRVAVVMVNYAPARLEGRFAAAPAALCSK
jgi:D-alanyl-D-alanine carboxypeptidase